MIKLYISISQFFRNILLVFIYNILEMKADARKRKRDFLLKIETCGYSLSIV